MSESNYIPSGELQGDTKSMPDRGTSTGMSGNTDLGGMSIGADSTNSMGSIKSSTKSDAIDECCSEAPNI
jgi:hypothetical protein